MNTKPLLIDSTPIHIALTNLDLDDFNRKGLDTIINSIQLIEEECTLINVALQLQDPYLDQTHEYTTHHLYKWLSTRLAAFCPCWLINEIFTHKIQTTRYEYKSEARVRLTDVKHWHVIKLLPVGLIDLVKG